MRVARVRSRLLGLFPGSGAAAFLATSLVVGVLVGAAAALLIEGLQVASDLVVRAGRTVGAPRFILFVTIPFGFVVASWLARRFAPDTAGDGVPETRAALALQSGHIPTRVAPMKLLTTILTVGAGGSAGREGPIVQIGGTIGSSLARMMGMGEDRVRSLVAAGAGAAIGASFNAPIAGMLFAMEVILGNFAVRHLNAVVVASVAAAVTARSLVGDELILRAFPFRLDHPSNLVLFAVLGAVAALVAWGFLRMVDVAGHRRLGGPAWLRPVLLGVAVAALALLAPEVSGTGQSYTGGLVRLLNDESIVWYSLGGIAAAKLAATALTLGSGGSGGAFMPSLFIGATVGAGFADLVGTLWPGASLQPGAFAVVGMAATFAAVARAPLTSILIVFELTQDYGMVLPLMLATSVATYLADRVHPASVYTMALARRGIILAPHSDVDLLDTVTVGEVLDRHPVVASVTMSIAEVEALMEESRLHGLPVVDDGRLVGIVTITDLARGGPSPGETAVSAVMTRRPATATPSTPVSRVLERMASLRVGRIPIVADDDPGRLVAVFRREDVVRSYQVALGQEIDHGLRRSRLQARTGGDTEFREVTIPPESVAVGRALRHIPMPPATTVVSVRRGATVLVPHGGTLLEAGDVLTVFAHGGGHLRLASRIGAGDTAEMDAITDDEVARFSDVEVSPNSPVVGLSIREIAVPAECAIVSVHRAEEIIVPDGDTVLLAGDRITVFAAPEARRSLVALLRVSPTLPGPDDSHVAPPDLYREEPSP